MSLLGLWCAAFDETVILNQLLSSLNMDEILSTNVQTDIPSEPEYIKLKIESLSSLLAVLTSWQPSVAATNQTSFYLVVWRFGLMCCRDSPLINKLKIDCQPNSEGLIPVRLLAFLRWFRKCLVEDRALQDRLVTESSSFEVNLLLQLHQLSLSNKATGLSQHSEYDKCIANCSFVVTRELNMICLVLLAAAQRVNREDDTKGSLQPAVCQLIFQEPYVDVITKGLEKVVLPLLPDPCRDFKEESCLQDQGKYNLS